MSDVSAVYEEIQEILPILKTPNKVMLGDLGIKSDGGTTDNFYELKYIKKHMNDVIGGERFSKSVALVFPNGSGVAMSRGFNIDESRTYIVGETPNTPVMFDDAFENVFTFDGNAAKSLYDCGIQDINIVCKGNASAGAAISVRNCINFRINNVTTNGAFEGINFYEAQRVRVQGFQSTQENSIRTSGIPGRGLVFRGDTKVCSDIIFDTLDLFYREEARPDVAIEFNAIDGVYFGGGGHIHGQVLYEPKGKGTELFASTGFGGIFYFDIPKIDVANILFKGESSVYRNFFFSNAYIAGGKNGIEVQDGTCEISKIKWSGKKISATQERAISVLRTNVTDMDVSHTSFDDNNKSNIAAGGDVYFKGTGLNMTANNFVRGGTNGTAIDLTGSTRCKIRDGSLLDSLTAKTVVEGDVSNKIKDLDGYANNVEGIAEIAIGATSVTIASGLDLNSIRSTSHYKIKLTLRTSSLDCGGLNTSGIINTTTGDFTVACGKMPTSKALFSWFIDLS